MGNAGWVASAPSPQFLDRMRTMVSMPGRSGIFPAAASSSGAIASLSRQSAMATRAAAARAAPAAMGASAASIGGSFIAANAAVWAAGKVLEVTGIAGAASALGGGFSRYMGKVAGGYMDPSAAGIYSSVLQEAGDSMPWLGAGVKRFYQPYESAGARVSGLLGSIVRGGGEVDTTQMNRLYEGALSQEKKAASVDFEVDKMVQQKLASSDVNSQAQSALVEALSKIGSALSSLAAGGGALNGGGHKYLSGAK